jgi:hypothetical protein
MSAWIVVAVLLGFILGWVAAHSTVARECERIGSFYVGDTVYVCVKRERR